MALAAPTTANYRLHDSRSHAFEVQIDIRSHEGRGAVAVGVFSSAKGGACLRASDRDGLSCAAKQAYASEHVRIYANTVCEFWSENEQI